VKHPALPRKELRRDDLAKQRVTESDTACVSIELEHEAVERVAERGADVVDRVTDDAGEELVVDGSAGDRERRENWSCGRE
jgi:hypothetical protein